MKRPFLHRTNSAPIVVARTMPAIQRDFVWKLVLVVTLAVMLLVVLSASAMAMPAQQVPDVDDAVAPRSLRVQPQVLPHSDDAAADDAVADDAAADDAINAAAASSLRLIIDTDPGVDDAAALVTLLSMQENAPTLLGIVTVSGNATARDGATNVLNILEKFGRTDIPVVIGLGSPYPGTGAAIHGPDGLWFQGLQNPQDLSGLSTDPIDFYCNSGDWGGATLLALGPLTNLNAAYDACPTAMATLGPVIVLGGAKVGGNITPVAEYNFWQDAGAAARFIGDDNDTLSAATRALDVTILPLDAFSGLTIAQSDVDKLASKGNAATQFILPALQIYFDVQTTNGGSATLPDVAAAVLAISPHYGESQSALVKVLSGPGLARGISVVGLSLNERLTMIADEATLAGLAIRLSTDPTFDPIAEYGAILIQEPDNVQFVTSINSKNIRKLFLKAATTAIPEVSGASGPSALPWIEDFNLPNGSRSDDGPTAWTLTNDGPNVKLTEVLNGELKIRKSMVDIVWASESVDISQVAAASVALNVHTSGRGFESSGPYVDFVKVYISVDGGALQLIDEYYGEIDGTVTVGQSDIVGNSVQVVVEARSSASNEIYYLDNVVVAESGVTAASQIIEPTGDGFSIFLPAIVR